MTIELPKDLRQQAIASIAPLVYNQAVADVQERLQARLAEIDLEVHEEPFQYWRTLDRPRRKS